MSEGFSIGAEHRPIIVGFEGTEPDWDWLQSVRPAGVILFTRNTPSLDHVRSLCARIHSLRPKPFIAIDMEGGRVNRLTDLVGDFPSPDEVLRCGDPRRAGDVMGMLLAALGIDVDFAPVADLDYGNHANGLAGRTWGREAVPTSHQLTQFCHGLNHWGVAATFKHFPGLGTTIPDSHLELPVYGLDCARWAQEEGAVYAELVKAGYGDVPVMFAHCCVPFWRGEIASLSPLAVGALRGMGWTGITMTDDMEMKAIPQAEIAAHAVEALEAGIDLVMVCRTRHVVDDVVAAIDRAGRSQARSAVIPSAAPKAPTLASAIERWKAFTAGDSRA